MLDDLATLILSQLPTFSASAGRRVPSFEAKAKLSHVDVVGEGWAHSASSIQSRGWGQVTSSCLTLFMVTKHGYCRSKSSSFGTVFQIHWYCKCSGPIFLLVRLQSKIPRNHHIGQIMNLKRPMPMFSASVSSVPFMWGRFFVTCKASVCYLLVVCLVFFYCRLGSLCVFQKDFRYERWHSSAQT